MMKFLKHTRKCHNYEGGNTLELKKIYIKKCLLLNIMKHVVKLLTYSLTHKQLLSSPIHLERAAASPQGRAVRSLSVQITHTLINLYQ